jgi:hypothetical protein
MVMSHNAVKMGDATSRAPLKASKNSQLLMRKSVETSSQEFFISNYMISESHQGGSCLLKSKLSQVERQPEMLSSLH